MPNSAINEGRITSISGRVTLDAIDHRIVLLAQDTEIQIIISRDRFSWRKLFYGFRFHKKIITAAHALLSYQGIRLVVEIAGIEVAALGRGAKSSLFTRAFFLAPLSIKVIPLIRAFAACKSI